MKIVIPVGSLETGGGCRVLADIANALVAKGYETEIVLPHWSPVAYPIDAKITRVPFLKKDNIPYGDIVLPNFYITFQPAFAAWPKQCIRLCQGFEPDWLTGENRTVALWTYQQRVPVISVSHWLDKRIQAHVGQRSTVVNLGIDPHVFNPGAGQEDIKSHHPKVILYIARDPKVGYALKGYDDFVKSMHLFKQSYEGDFIVHMICTERELPLPGIPHRTFQPTDDIEMVELYRAADVFVSTSWIEGFGLPPLEAMACGTPVVTTNSGGVMDFCRHLESAYVVPPKHPEAVATGIRSILSNPNLARRLVRGGEETASRLTKRSFAENIVVALEQIERDRHADSKE
ncbi:glycosyltransferase family 4 protein [Desmospora activa]|uniref:Glycosyltransferase involved in cell wall biosynthesis n=1 Tax=Desmospora activa DSM 45169 TaxID=1121389 RepID=A0A2T4ZAD1_9BACL|nr:glycosyltransferase family 4 protein [Desmospora activa]PTM58849.1 glycosyltransferase involved in cell wall biosynthesis [Desmospora activa DSM 45169]